MPMMRRRPDASAATWSSTGSIPLRPVPLELNHVLCTVPCSIGVDYFAALTPAQGRVALPIRCEPRMRGLVFAAQAWATPGTGPCIFGVEFSDTIEILIQ